MRICREVRLLRRQAARALRRIADAVVLDVDSGDAEHGRRRIRAADRRRRVEVASTIGAVASAVSSGEQDVGACRYKARDDEVEGMVWIVAVVARMSRREVP